MTPTEYLSASERTDCDYGVVMRRLQDLTIVKFMHACLGIVTEAGELADILKRAVFYGKPVDWVHFEEELGDLLWYIALAVRVCGGNFEAIMERNIAKLQKRFPEKFSEDQALTRDVDAERKALETAADIVGRYPLPMELSCQCEVHQTCVICRRRQDMWGV